MEVTPVVQRLPVEIEKMINKTKTMLTKWTLILKQINFLNRTLIMERGLIKKG